MAKKETVSNFKPAELLAACANYDELAAALTGCGKCGKAYIDSDSIIDGCVRGVSESGFRVLLSSCGVRNTALANAEFTDDVSILLDCALDGDGQEYREQFVAAVERCDGAVFVSAPDGSNSDFILNFAIQYAWERGVPFYILEKNSAAADNIKNKFSSVDVIDDISKASFKTENAKQRPQSELEELFEAEYTAIMSGWPESAAQACEKIKAFCAGKKNIDRKRCALACELCGECFAGAKRYSEAAKYYAESSGFSGSPEGLRAAAMLEVCGNGLHGYMAGSKYMEAAVGQKNDDTPYDLCALADINTLMREDNSADECIDEAKKLVAGNTHTLTGVSVTGHLRHIDIDALSEPRELIRAAALFKSANSYDNTVRCYDKALNIAKKSGEVLLSSLCARRLRELYMATDIKKALSYSRKACEEDEKRLGVCQSEASLDIMARDMLITGLLGGGSRYFERAAEIWNGVEGCKNESAACAKLAKGMTKRQASCFKKEYKKRRFAKWVRDLGKLQIPVLLLAIVVGICILAGLSCGVHEVHEIITEARATHETTMPQYYEFKGKWHEYDELEIDVRAKNMEFWWDLYIESAKPFTIDWGENESRFKAGKQHIKCKMESDSFKIIASDEVKIVFRDGSKFDSSISLTRPAAPTTTTKKTTKKTARQTQRETAPSTVAQQTTATTAPDKEPVSETDPPVPDSK